MRATAAALLVVLGLAACGDGEKSGARLSDQQLARLVLLARDAGPRYQQFADGRTARIELNSALDDDATRFGRQDGWTSRYRNRGRRGALTVASTVDVF